jgi:hypothetical protein
VIEDDGSVRLRLDNAAEMGESEATFSGNLIVCLHLRRDRLDESSSALHGVTSVVASGVACDSVGVFFVCFGSTSTLPPNLTVFFAAFVTERRLDTLVKSANPAMLIVFSRVGALFVPSGQMPMRPQHLTSRRRLLTATSVHASSASARHGAALSALRACRRRLIAMKSQWRSRLMVVSSSEARSFKG